VGGIQLQIKPYLNEEYCIIMSRSVLIHDQQRGKKMNTVKMNSTWLKAEPILTDVCTSPLLALFDEQMK
jgi:hypothetical protein